MSATIGICLATCNGARFLPEQLESIEAQNFADWYLYARDDVSDDGSAAMLTRFAKRHPDRVTLVSDSHGRLGARGNFSRLMGLVREPYIAFADQDDVWNADKLARTLDTMRALEAQDGGDRPCMVHADRALIDTDGRAIAPSYWGSRGLNRADFKGFETHLTFCVAAGSTMLVNQPLLALARPVPSEARMYDCWLELLAHAFGAVAVVDDVVLDHRRHGGNLTGASRETDSPAQRRIWRRAIRLLANLGTQRRVYRLCFDQATVLRARHGHALPPELVQRLDLFLSIPDRWFPGRLRALRASGCAPPGGPMRALVFVALSGESVRSWPADWPDTVPNS